MKRGAAILIAAAALAGCASTSPDTPRPVTAIPVNDSPSVAQPGTGAPISVPETALSSGPHQLVDSTNQIVAMVNGRAITQEQLTRPLIEAYGLQMLLQLIKLELAKQMAADRHIGVQAADIRAERTLTLKGVFQDADEKDYDALLEQLLKREGLTHPQFELLLETNAYLRKVALPMCEGKIQDENLKLAFNMMYGEKVKVLDIAVSNPRAALAAKQRVMAGEDFGTVAEQVSQDIRTRGLRGELPPFSRQSNVPDTIKNLAFDMKDGDVSDPIAIDGTYHVIKVVSHIAPTIAKFEDQKPAVYRLLHEKLVQDVMKGLQADLAKAALEPGVMKIENDELRRQFDQKAAEHRAAVQDQATAQREVAQARRVPATVATSQPATAPTTGAATAPSTVAPATSGPAIRVVPGTVPASGPSTVAPVTTGAGRPPATMPGAATGAGNSSVANPGRPATLPNSPKP